MNILVIGAGLIGRAIVYGLVGRSGIKQIKLADREGKRAQRIADWIADPRVVPMRLDATAPRAVHAEMKDCTAAISAVPYFLNLALARAAVDTGTHFCDLGGNNRTVAAELALNEQAKQAGVTVIPDCGLAPGLVNILTASATRDLDQVDSVRIRVGGLPQNPHPPLNYQIGGSTHGLINEYMDPARILSEGKIVEVPSLSGLEEISFPHPYQNLEAFHTSGGSSTLPDTMLNRVNNLDYKTIRYSGHMEKVKTLADLGFFDEEPREIDDKKVVPRAMSVSLLTERLSGTKPDVVLLRITAHGRIGKDPRTVRYQLIDVFDNKTGLSAMSRTTGFSAAQICEMLATGRIHVQGAIPQENCVPAEEFLLGLQQRGLNIERQVRG